MADMQVASRRNPTMTRENGSLYAWANPAGALVAMSFKDAMVAAGYGFHVTVGALTTPIVGGGAGTVLVIATPELIISVPSGTAIMPIRIKVDCELPADLDNDIEEIVIAVDRTQALTSGGTSTTEVAFNMRSDNPTTSLCSVYSAVTVTVAPTPVHGIELARKQEHTNLLTAGITQGFMDLLYEPLHPPIIVGPANVSVMFGGVTAMSGFINAQWVEMPEALNSLWGGS